MTSRLSCLIFAAGLAMTSAVFAQNAPDAPAPQPADPVLKGPDVKDNSVPGERRRLGQPGQGRDARQMPAVRLETLNRAIDVLRGEKAPAEIRLSAEQDTQIKSIVDTFRTDTRAYAEKHREEMRQLAEQAGLGRQQARSNRGDRLRQGQGGGKAPEGQPAPGNGEEPMMDAPPPPGPGGPEGGPRGRRPGAPGGAEPTPEQQAAREKLEAIRAGAPKMEDATGKVMNVLTEPQREAVKKEMEKLAQQQRGPRPGAGPEGQPPQGGPQGGPNGQRQFQMPSQEQMEKMRADMESLAKDLPNLTDEQVMEDPRVPEMFRERLKQMDPERRAQMMDRFRERAASGEPMGFGRGERRRREGEGQGEGGNPPPPPPPNN